jgi:hypothetical protein
MCTLGTASIEGMKDGRVKLMRIKVSVGNELFNLNCGDFTAFHISADVGSGDRSIVAIFEQCNQYASSGGLECSTLVMPQA